MDASIIIAIIFGISSIITSVCFGLIPNIRKDKLLKLESKNQKILWDLKLYHEIEDELLRELEQHGENFKNTKERVRREISGKNDGKVLSDYTKPSVYSKLLK